MFNLLLPAATFLPQVLENIGLPNAVYLETVDENTGLSTCSVSLYFVNDAGRFDDLRVFTASSTDGMTNAKHLASLDAIQNLQDMYKFTIVDVCYKTLVALESGKGSASLSQSFNDVPFLDASTLPLAALNIEAEAADACPAAKKRKGGRSESSGSVTNSEPQTASTKKQLTLSQLQKKLQKTERDNQTLRTSLIQSRLRHGRFMLIKNRCIRLSRNFNAAFKRIEEGDECARNSGVLPVDNLNEFEGLGE